MGRNSNFAFFCFLGFIYKGYNEFISRFVMITTIMYIGWVMFYFFHNKNTIFTKCFFFTNVMFLCLLIARPYMFPLIKLYEGLFFIKQIVVFVGTIMGYIQLFVYFFSVLGRWDVQKTAILTWHPFIGYYYRLNRLLQGGIDAATPITMFFFKFIFYLNKIV